jgi:hypothetical protein
LGPPVLVQSVDQAIFCWFCSMNAQTWISKSPRSSKPVMEMWLLVSSPKYMLAPPAK